MPASFEQRVLKIISRIPQGKVATYGQIAALAGSPRSARVVGMILRRRAEHLPWQRVINKAGRVSIMNIEYPAEVQAESLRQEGIEVKESDGEFLVSLSRYLWEA